jgi:hypothetical protein
MTSPVSNIPVSSDYTSRDYYALREELVTRVKSRVPEWTGTDSADFGVALIEAFAFMGDQLNYYVDRVANENYLATATQRQSILEIASSLGYLPTGYLASTLDVTITNTAGTRYAVTTAELTSNVVTLTLSIEHEFIVGDEVQVTSVGAPFDGVFTITTVGLDTISYAVTNTDVPSASVSGTADTYTIATTLPTGTQFSIDVVCEDEVRQLFFTTTEDVFIADQQVSVVPAINGEWAGSRTENLPQDDFDVAGEWIGTSNGLPDQVYQLAENQVVEGTTKVYVQNGDTYQQWTQVTHITDSGPNEAVYYITTDADNFVYINFGDGVSGAIPSNLTNIKVDYLIGGGVLGNVPAGIIYDIFNIPGKTPEEISTISSVCTLQNTAGLGGSEPESNDNIRFAAPIAFTAQNRAVTVQDYANLALSVSEVGKTSAVAETRQAVTVFVGPNPDPTDPFQFPGYDARPADGGQLTPAWLSLKDAVLSQLSDKLQIGTTLTVAPPVYASVAIEIQFNKLPQFTDEVVTSNIKSALASIFDYSNATFSALIYPEDVEFALRSVEGVASVQVKQLYRAAVPPLTPPARELLVGGANELFVFEEDDMTIYSSTALSSLILSDGTLAPTFHPSVVNYAVALPDGTTDITVTPEVASALSTIDVNGTAVLSGDPSGAILTPVGTTPVIITVTAEDGVTTRVYIITLTRAA